ncbi:hypothetical protein YC2023_016851 [Brassica napus]
MSCTEQYNGNKTNCFKLLVTLETIGASLNVWQSMCEECDTSTRHVLKTATTTTMGGSTFSKKGAAAPIACIMHKLKALGMPIRSRRKMEDRTRPSCNSHHGTYILLLLKFGLSHLVPEEHV